MLAARVVLRGFDGIAWGSAGPTAVTVDRIDLGGERLSPGDLSAKENAEVREVLWEAWERACEAPIGVELLAA